MITWQTLFIVDDNPHFIALLVEWLETFFQGISILTATDGAIVLTMLEELHELPILMILDVYMPTSNGIQLAENIHDRFPEIPILLTTSLDAESVDQAARRTGLLGCVPKHRLPDVLPAYLSPRDIPDEGER